MSLSQAVYGDYFDRLLSLSNTRKNFYGQFIKSSVPKKNFLMMIFVPNLLDFHRDLCRVSSGMKNSVILRIPFVKNVQILCEKNTQITR